MGNHLDLDAVIWLDDYLSEKYPHSVIVISHDADFLDEICTDILHLDNKQLVHYRGDYSSFKKMHDQNKARQDKLYDQQQKDLKQFKAKGLKKEDAMAKLKEKYGIDPMEEMPSKVKDYVVKFRFMGHGQNRADGINVSQVAFSYDGKQPWLLSDIEIGADCGSRIAMVGPNGAGKSTLLNLIMEQLEPCKGEVRTTKGIRVKQYHQHFEELLPFEKTGIEYLAGDFNLTPERARQSLGQFGLKGESHMTKIGNLSGGQKARVAFAALMLTDPHIIVLDEPTNHLDIESVEALIKAICDFNGGLIIVTHDARLIQSIDCNIWVVEEGTAYEFEKGFEGYKDKIIDQLEERTAEIERAEKKRREEREKLRLKHVSMEKVQKATEQKKIDAAEQASKPKVVAKEEKKEEKKEEEEEDDADEDDDEEEENKEEEKKE